MEEKIKSVLINIIIGDAFGSILEGLSKGHIKSLCQREMLSSGFIEPDRTIIKNRKWRKPGLYTSISQFMIITALSMGRKGFNRSGFLEKIRISLNEEDSTSGIFRHPGPVEKSVMENAGVADISSGKSIISTARIIPSSVPLIFTQKGRLPDIRDILSYVTIFSNDSLTAAGILIFTALIYHFLFRKCEIKEIKQESIEIIAQTRKNVDLNSPLLFKLGLNPLNIIKDIDRYLHILESMREINENDAVEKIICSELNKTMKTPVKRASIDNPLALLPYSLHLAVKNQNPHNASMEAAMEGGAASSLGAITGALTASILGKSAVNEILLKNIENRKRILKITDSIADMNIKEQLFYEFITTEASLTRNEILEYHSRIKNLKEKQKKNLTRREKENKLTGHVVESWTKTDKAKWKKQKKKINKQSHKKI